MHHDIDHDNEQSDNSKQPFIIGNWKMHLNAEQAFSLIEFYEEMVEEYAEYVQIAACVPAPYLLMLNSEVEDLLLGAQDCHHLTQGAYTGDISAQMLSGVGTEICLVGHSERRQYHHETSAQVKQKALALEAEQILPVICIGETQEEYETARTRDVLAQQIVQSIPDNMAQCVVAYEPVWAIGSGKTPTSTEIANIHAFIIEQIEALGYNRTNIDVLYGGSVNAENAASILAIDGVDGVLVGGASLKPAEMELIVKAAASAKASLAA